MAKNEQFYTVREVAEMLKISTATVLAYIQAGKLRCVKLSARAYRVPATELTRFMSGGEALGHLPKN